MDTAPFHEAIIEVIEHADSPEKLSVIEEILLTTDIPEGHAEILAAFRDKCVEFDMDALEVEEKFREEGDLIEEEE